MDPHAKTLFEQNLATFQEEQVPPLDHTLWMTPERAEFFWVPNSFEMPPGDTRLGGVGAPWVQTDLAQLEPFRVDRARANILGQEIVRHRAATELQMAISFLKQVPEVQSLEGAEATFFSDLGTTAEVFFARSSLAPWLEQYRAKTGQRGELDYEEVARGYLDYLRSMHAWAVGVVQKVDQR